MQKQLTESASDTIAIFCVGNYHLSDDGFGIHLFHSLQGTPLPDNVRLCEFGLMGLSQTDFILPYQKLIVADALKGMGRPGEIFRFDLLREPSAFCKSMLSSHDLGIMDLLEMIRWLNPENLPKQAILFGVEADVTDRYGTTLSPQIDNAVFKIRDMVLEELGTSSLSIKNV